MAEELGDSNNEHKEMDSLDKKCNKLKHAYDACFNQWFSESFLKGGGGGNGDGSPKKTLLNPCDAMLKSYSDCVKSAMKERNMDPIIYAKYWEDAAEIRMGRDKKRSQDEKGSL